MSVAERFVRSACRLGPVPQVAEIRLHLADDVLGLWQRAEDEFTADQPPPFWAFAWPGGQALARYVLDHPGLVAGRSVLDLGSGSGLVAIAAAKAGAAIVVASEVDPLAVAAIGLNARANGVPALAVTGTCWTATSRTPTWCWPATSGTPGRWPGACSGFSTGPWPAARRCWPATSAGRSCHGTGSGYSTHPTSPLWPASRIRA